MTSQAAILASDAIAETGFWARRESERLRREAEARRDTQEDQTNSYLAWLENVERIRSGKRSRIHIDKPHTVIHCFLPGTRRQRFKAIRQAR